MTLVRRCTLFLVISSGLMAADWQPITLTGTDGTYTDTQWQHDWPGCDWGDGIKAGRLSVVTSPAGKALRVQYAVGQIGTEKGGCAWRWPFAAKDNAGAELRYTVTFEPGFEFVKGGKLPGLCGGPENISGGNCDRSRWLERPADVAGGRARPSLCVSHEPARQMGRRVQFPGGLQVPRGAASGRAFARGHEHGGCS